MSSVSQLICAQTEQQTEERVCAEMWKASLGQSYCVSIQSCDLHLQIQANNQVDTTGTDSETNKVQAQTLFPEVKWKQHIITFQDLNTSSSTSKDAFRSEGIDHVYQLSVHIDEADPHICH